MQRNDNGFSGHKQQRVTRLPRIWLKQQLVEIPLTQGKWAIIDACDAEKVLQHKWYAHKDYHTYYALTNIRKEDGTPTILRLHRLILKPHPQTMVDHINGNGLDNRRCNLRLATNRQNLQNSRIPLTNTSGFKGVYWEKQKCRWRVQIYVDGKNKNLGSFKTKKEAAATYDRAAIKFFGQFAKPNGQHVPRANLVQAELAI